LKQLGMAVHMYASDWDGRFYHCDSSWQQAWDETHDMWEIADALFPYTKNEQIFRCPSRGGNIYNASVQVSPKTGLITDHETVPKWRYGRSLDDPQVGNPGACTLMGDYPCNDCVGGEIRPGVRTLHNAGINILFVDGHVKWMSSQKVRCSGDLAWWWNWGVDYFHIPWRSRASLRAVSNRPDGRRLALGVEKSQRGKEGPKSQHECIVWLPSHC